MKLAASPRQQSVEQDVLGYMIQHPGVHGTIEDIVWWIVDVRIRRALKDVRTAVERLVKLGWVTTQASRNGKASYRMNPDKEQEILSLLAPKPRRGISSRRKSNC